MINEISKLFKSHPVYHLFAGSIKLLDNKYIVKDNEGKVHHINLGDVIDVTFKEPSALDKGYLKIEYLKNKKSTDTFLFFDNQKRDQMNQLYNKMKNK